MDFIFAPILVCGSALVTVAGFLFWIWVLIDCLTKEPSEGNEKLIWVLVIVLLTFIGALVYFFVRRPDRIRQFGR